MLLFTNLTSVLHPYFFCMKKVRIFLIFLSVSRLIFEQVSFLALSRIVKIVAVECVFDTSFGMVFWAADNNRSKALFALV